MVGTPAEDLSFKDAARTKIGNRLEGETFEYGWGSLPDQYGRATAEG